MLEESDNYGESFPKDSTLCDIAVLLCTVIRNHTELEHLENDTVFLSKDKFIEFVVECARKYSFAWSKEYRELPVEKTTDRLCELMESWMLLKETSVGVVLYPGVYKFTGIYPKSITEEKNTANKNLSDENIIHTK